MDFFDCNCCFGRPARPDKSPLICPEVDDLLGQLVRAGIGRAIAWHVAQFDVSPQYGNAILADAIRNRPNLLGAWTVLPDQTGEMPLDKLFDDMKANRIVALRVFPPTGRYLLNALTMGPLLDEMTARHIPLIYSIKRIQPSMGETQVWRTLYDLLADFPDLVVIVADHSSWGSDRLFRPLIENYPGVHIETSLYFIDGGIEDFVEHYGPESLLFGSGLPERYPGGGMLALRHAEFSESDKLAVAAGNLDRIVKEVRL